ncbi:MAG: UbiA prenyltransferase family protein [Thermoplasmata archaeon]|nr:UbiA prenyltransferase family protein [Thermoplasmata archaeon]
MTKVKLVVQKILQYIRASRIDGWYITAVFFLLGEWYSIQLLPFVESFIPLIGMIGIVSTGFWINHVFDKEIDIAAGKDRRFFDYIKPQEMILSSVIVFLLCSALLLYVNSLSFIIGVSIFLLGVIYSAPPLRIKNRPPFDAIANGLGIGVLPFLLGWAASGNNLTAFSVTCSIICGLAVVSHYFFYTSFDIETDKDCNVRTSCTILGFNRSISTGIIIYFFSLFLSTLLLGLSVITIAFICCIPFVSALKLLGDKMHLNFLVGCIFLTWSGVTMFLLTIYSRSVITLFLFVVTVLFFAYLSFSILNYHRRGYQSI